MTKIDEKGRIILGDEMKSKDKTGKYISLTLKKIILFLAFAIIILWCISTYNYYFSKNEVYAKETIAIQEEGEKLKISKAEEVDLDAIIAENTKSEQKEEYITEEVKLEYITKYQSNSSLPKGIIQVVQEGREGKQQITKKRIYENGEIITEEQISSKITQAAVNKIVEVGNGSYTSNYKVKAGDTVYVTSDRAGVMVEPNEESQKIATLSKGKELKVLSVQGNWYRISETNTTGYVKTENTTYINPNVKEQEENTNSSNSQSVKRLSFDMALNKPSGLSLEQFKKILTDSKDVNKVFANNAEYFYYIEKEYNINGIFVAAVGIHESNWGTSTIAKEKNNLFGYGAYDSNPYYGAYQFSNYSECIDLIARVFVKYYLNPKGTSIYGGEQAVGSYYNGPTLAGVNTKYATDKNWANGVYNHMKYLYNKL